MGWDWLLWATKPILLECQLPFTTEFSSGQDLKITNVTSPSSAQLLVSWTSSSTLVSFFMLDLRVVNNATIAPITAITSVSTRSRLIQGLRTGTFYNITLRSYQANGAVLAISWVQSQTVPATPQIATSNGISSSEITVGWSSQGGVDYYFLMVSLGTDVINRTFTTLNCSISGLQPSSLYSLTLYAVNSAGASAPSRRITVLTLTPPPMNVTVTSLSSYSVTLSWLVVDKALMYGIFIYEDGPTPTLTFIRKTTSTTILLDNLLPCTRYIFGLTSYNWFYTAGEENRVSQQTGQLDSPQSVTIQYDSNMGTALLSWKSSIGATLYQTSAISNNGQVMLYPSTSNSYNIQNLLCEQTYTVTVTALINGCSSNNSDPLTLQTAPCAPQNVTVVRQCQINTVSLSWNPVVNATKYTANAFAPDGTKEECVNWDTYCFFINLQCGTEYEMSVFAVSDKVNGSRSPGIKIRTAPCDPHDVEAIVQCTDNTLVVSWRPSVGATYYTASALGSSDVSYNCSSVNTSCRIRGLRCGESVSVSVIAYDDECASMSSSTETIVTVPCAPITVSATTDCNTHSTLVQWDYSEGAVRYIAQAKASDGSEYSCESYNLHCHFNELPCSQTYTVYVTADNYQCMSPYSPPVEVKSVPCTPQIVSTELFCSQNTVLVTWTEDTGNITFEATAWSDFGHYHCRTQESHCEISNVSCGEMFSVLVHANNSQCISSSNQSAPFYSAPCKPTDVSAVSICANGSTQISWTNSSGIGVETYVGQMQSSDGAAPLMCQSTTGTCVIEGTKCGEVYKATVTAVGTRCQTVSNASSVIPVPCTPTNFPPLVGAEVVHVLWSDSTGAVNYTSVITGNNGDNHECLTSNTSCSVTDLMCGSQYRMTVTANGQYCSSNSSYPQSFNTAPCSPQVVTAEVDCTNHIATVSWDESLGAENYTALAVASDGENVTCRSTTTSCDIAGLMCSQIYVITVSAANKYSNSKASLPVELLIAPCTPTSMRPLVSAEVVDVSWLGSNGAMNYTTVITGDSGDKYECHTTNTSCSVTELMCGSQYSMTVTANGRYCSSNRSDTQAFQTAPCTPQNVTANLDCVTNAATIAWSPSPGAENYTASAMIPDGGNYVCHSTTTHCDIAGLTCGQKYQITVSAANNYGSSKASLPIELLTAPCVPLQETPQLICANNSVSLSWSPTSGAISYIANVSSPGDELSCHTTDTNCIIHQLKCGQTYNATVTAINQQCKGPAALPAKIPTAPCQPRNVVTDINCSSSMVKLNWEESLGAQSYYSMLRTPDNQYLICNSTELGCDIPGLPCGQAYDVTVTAVNDRCESQPSSPSALYTVPCVPSLVRADIHCESNVVTVSWAQTAGAVNYTTVAAGPQGEQLYCQSSNTSCSYTQLSCGLKFDVSVVAVGNSCSSGFSGAVPFYTAPCAVRNIHAQYQCGSDYADVTWEAAPGGVTYTAMLISEDGWRSICNSSVSSCVVYYLKCGQKYTVSVETFGPSCSSTVNATEFVFTAPCKPQNVTADIDCQTNHAALSWSRTPGATNYTASIIGPEVDGPTCNTTSTSCNIDHLTCGLTYDFIVTASNAQCEGESSVVTQLVTAPCAPDDIVTEMDCDTGSLVLSWNLMADIENFTSNLMGPDGVNRTCKSMGANCSFPGLPCGGEYTAAVYGTNKYCDGPTSTNVQIQSAPCAPENIHPSLNCTDNSVLVSWGPSSGAFNYTMSMADSYGYRSYCGTEDIMCQVPDLQCGEVYTVAVTAWNQVCSSKESSVTELLTAPCSPVNLQVNITSGLVVLTWGEAHGAVNYTAEVTGTDGEVYTCHTSNTSCETEDLKCGHQYSMSATAIGPRCSKVSENHVFQTAPCCPENVLTELDCTTNLVTVSWNISSGADWYYSEAVGSNGTKAICNSTTTSCDFIDLTCGTLYLVTVTANNEASSSETSFPIEITTAPCVPVQEIPQPNCYNASAFLAWSNTSGAISYVANMTGPEGDIYSCETEDTTCTISGLTCGQPYIVTITAINEQCSSPASDPVTLTTGPCEPQNVVSNISCSNSSTLLTWDEAPGALTYVSRLTSLDGDNFGCNSTDGFCEIPGLECGQSYHVTVTAFSSECQSAPSVPVVHYTEPCVPTNLQAEVDYDSHWASVSWTTVFGAEDYTAVVTGPQMERYYCNSIHSSCNFTQLSCGLEYEATILANGKICSSTVSPAITFYTAPCLADNIELHYECGAEYAVVAWDAALGAMNYTASISTQHGHVVTCSTAGTNCTVSDMQCGQVYSVIVDSFGMQSSSRSVSPGLTQTGPCVPQNVSVYIDCQTNSVAVSWASSPGSTNYTALITTSDGDIHTCHTTSTACNITGLNCGATYTLTVTACNDRCLGESSAEVEVITAPCAPEHVHAETDCATNAIVLFWMQNNGTYNFTSILRTPTGNMTCISDQMNCTFYNLPCGHEFMVSVWAANSLCRGPMSTSAKAQTAPCIPMSVNTALDCISNSALISWSESQGALNYSSSLVGPEGERYNCSSQETSCWVTDVPCGGEYTVAMMAQNDICRSVKNSDATLQTCPCVPQNMSIFSPCNSSEVKVQWVASAGAVRYEANVISPNGTHYMCNTTNTTCDIGGLQCGQTYNVTVTVFNDHLANVSLEQQTFSTSPCIPTNLRAELLCGNTSATLLWDPAQGAATYSVLVTGSDAWRGTCSSSNTTCEISDLQCGQGYRVTLIASNAHCSSAPSTLDFYTGPCAPQHLDTDPACASDYITLLWSAASGADYYTGTLTDLSGKTLTCNTTDLRCDISGIECGSPYTVTSAAHNDQCHRGNNPAVTIVTAPCVPTNLVTSVTCENPSVSLSWDVAPGATTYTVTARVGENETSITTTNTYCEFDHLLCDMEYDVILTSRSAHCISNGNNSVQIKTIPCPPRVLEAYASCDNNLGFIQWEISPNAKSYRVVVEGVTTWASNTTNTAYETPELECGQNYTVTVWTEDGTCTGPNSTTTTFKTVPCVPQNINTTVTCQENALNVFWDMSHGASSYSATAVGAQGDVVTADVSDNYCLLSPLQCGEVYSLTILASNDECKSAESATREVKSVPCSPMHLTVTPDCGINGASAQWEPSAGAVSYIAVFLGPDGSEVSCESSTPSCSVSELQCGQHYNVTVTAFDGSCHSITTNATTVTTAPCTPADIETNIDCSSPDLVNVTWSPSRGAQSYVVVAKGNNGHTLSCNTTTSMCVIQGARCGYTYSVSVTAWNIYCSSNASTEVTTETVPCTPNIKEVTIDCLTYEALLSWNENNTYAGYDTAVAIDPSGNELICGGFSTSCLISDLECGLEYSFHVYSSTRRCRSLNSAVYKSMTAPCQPRNITTNVQCENNDALISWTESRGAIYYLATLSGNGTISSCNTTTTNCSYLSLQCGQTYNVSVMAVNDKCDSVLSPLSTFETAPCQPQGLITDLDCSSQIASMSWEVSDGAQGYTVFIEDTDGAVSPYTPSTFFRSDVLACGRTYMFSVVAIGGTCNSSRSLTMREYSAPCAPLNVTYIRNCPTSMASVTWSASEGAVMYSVMATAAGGLETSCNSTDTSCWLMGLDCGLSYNVKVEAVGQMCASNTSSLVVLNTAPCLPQNAAVKVNCANNSAVLSWEESRGAVDYVATVKHDEDLVHSCDTEGTSCMVPDLTCGASYSFSVVAKDVECNSSHTTPIGFGAVPCPPSEVESSIYRGSVKPQEVEVAWNESHCGSDYMATIQGQIGYDPESAFVLNSYWTSYMDFYIPVPCSSVYNVTVTARNAAGPSYPTDPIIGYTAPCTPQIKPLEVTEGRMLISWEPIPYADEYRVLMADNTTIVCTTPGLSCQVNLSYNAFQVIAVNAAGQSPPAYLSGYGGTMR
ncbi:uncharacterized protein LOC130275479 isoform X3 [Hyla sarda]|uniref:uncharacterized protein LOC130275479 isoform X3 n=1 Tax=Hyla sarda TaxID=327740 RepID=UPI0024C39BDF|nr:uncharacterized protein LOC130275479 isoform X3 [Hyla sarda]